MPSGSLKGGVVCVVHASKVQDGCCFGAGPFGSGRRTNEIRPMDALAQSAAREPERHVPALSHVTSHLSFGKA